MFAVSGINWNAKKPISPPLLTPVNPSNYPHDFLKTHNNYVLAYCYLSDGDKQRTLNRLRMIKDRAYLRYARTHDKFQKLDSNDEFKELTR